MNYQIKVKQIRVNKGSMYLNIEGFVRCDIPDSNYIPKAKLVLYFDNGQEDRRIPFLFDRFEKRDGGFWFQGEDRSYLLAQLFWKTKLSWLPTKLTFALQCGNEYEENIAVDYSELELDTKGAYYDCKMDEGVFCFQRKERYRLPYPLWKKILL